MYNKPIISVTGPQKPTIPSVSIDNIVVKWNLYCQRFSAETQIVYANRINHFVKSLRPQVRLINQIGRYDVMSYLATLQARRVQNRTYNSHLATLKTFFRFLNEFYDIDPPTDKIKRLRSEPSHIRVITESEYESIKSLNDNRFEIQRARALFLANTGLRSSEFVNMRSTDIAADCSAVVVVGKGGKRRSIPLNSLCRDLLKKYSRLNLKKNNRPFNREKLNYDFRLLSAAAGIDCFNPHALRHYFATSLLLRGVTIQLVSKLLGHSSISLTEKTYIHILPRHLAGITECLLEC